MKRQFQIFWYCRSPLHIASYALKIEVSICHGVVRRLIFIQPSCQRKDYSSIARTGNCMMYTLHVDLFSWKRLFFNRNVKWDRFCEKAYIIKFPVRAIEMH